MIEQKIINWANAEIQHRRGRGAIVISSQAKLLPVSVPADRCHKYSPVCKVVVPVILESREETLDEIYFSNIEVARITGKDGDKMSKDEKAGYKDRLAGFYDKWYRYNRKDDGAEYDKGVVKAVNSEKCPEEFFLIECNLI